MHVCILAAQNWNRIFSDGRASLSVQFWCLCSAQRPVFCYWLFDEPLRRVCDNNHLSCISDEVEGGGAGLLTGCGNESPLCQSAVQTSESSGKTRQQEGVPGRWDAPLYWGGQWCLLVTVCWFQFWWFFYSASCVLPLCRVDVTAVCILEGFQNQQSMLLADKVLKQLGKEKAKDKYKVNKCSLCQIFV